MRTSCFCRLVRGADHLVIGAPVFSYDSFPGALPIGGQQALDSSDQIAESWSRRLGRASGRSRRTAFPRSLEGGLRLLNHAFLGSFQFTMASAVSPFVWPYGIGERIQARRKPPS